MFRKRFGRAYLQLRGIGPDYVGNHVWVGNHVDAQQYHRFFNCVVSVGKGATDYELDVYVPLTPYDEEQAEEFERAVNTVVNRMKRGDHTLVHCHEGRERAPSVAITALAVVSGKAWNDEYTRVKSERELIEPPEELETLGKQTLYKE